MRSAVRFSEKIRKIDFYFSYLVSGIEVLLTYQILMSQDLYLVDSGRIVKFEDDFSRVFVGCRVWL